jgi:hypothetical protein
MREGGSVADDAKRQDALFVNLVLIFKNAALQQMGKFTNPITGKIEKDLEQARYSIDTIEMLREKTRGNLNPELEKLLDSTLMELRMNYVEEADAEVKEKAKSEKETEPFGGTKPEAEPQHEPGAPPGSGAEPEATDKVGEQVKAGNEEQAGERDHAGNEEQAGKKEQAGKQKQARRQAKTKKRGGSS